MTRIISNYLPFWSKVVVVRDDDFRRAWAESKVPRCQVCWADPQQAVWLGAPRGLEIHHIVRGAGRSDEPCNLLLLCCRCHDHAPGHKGNWRMPDGRYWPMLEIEHILYVKREDDPDEYNPQRLAALKRRRSIGCAQPLPVEYMRERQRHGPLRSVEELSQEHG